MANALELRMNEHLQRLQRDHAVARLWQRDAALFSADSAVQKTIRERLGWLFHIDAMRTQVERLAVLARVTARLSYDRVLVVGMGGSSLWPEVLGKHLKGKRGLPVRIIDSTHPEAVAEVIAWGHAGKPLFVIATKSGGTIETISTYRALRQIWKDGADFTNVFFLASLARGVPVKAMKHAPFRAICIRVWCSP